MSIEQMNIPVSAYCRYCVWTGWVMYACDSRCNEVWCRDVSN